MVIGLVKHDGFLIGTILSFLGLMRVSELDGFDRFLSSEYAVYIGMTAGFALLCLYATRDTFRYFTTAQIRHRLGAVNVFCGYFCFINAGTFLGSAMGYPEFTTKTFLIYLLISMTVSAVFYLATLQYVPQELRDDD